MVNNPAEESGTENFNLYQWISDTCETKQMKK